MNQLNNFTIEEYTSSDPITVGPATKIEEVIVLLHKHGFRHLPVVENGRPVGIISDRDILVARPMGVSGVLLAREVMTKDPYSVRIDARMEDVVLALSKRKFGSALVLDREGKLYGIFTATDALNALIEILRGE